jgi:hypothetical protein
MNEILLRQTTVGAIILLLLVHYIQLLFISRNRSKLSSSVCDLKTQSVVVVVLVVAAAASAVVMVVVVLLFVD